MIPAAIADESGSRVRDRFLSRVARALEKRDLDRARALGESLVAKDPGSSEARFALALAALLADDLAGAAALAVEAFEADPKVRETAISPQWCMDWWATSRPPSIMASLRRLRRRRPVSALLPPSLPPFARVLCEISEQPLLERGSRALGAGAWPAAEHWLRHSWPSSRTAERPRSSWPCACSRKAARVPLPMCCVPPGIRRPADAEIASLLGRALTASGRFAEAAACHRHAISQAPEDPLVHAAVLVDTLADPACRPDDAAARVRAWGRKFGERRTPGLPRSTSVATRPLVVGLFVAGNADSPEATALTRILMHRDADRFTMVGFGHGSLSENLNIGFQKAVDRWHDIGDCDPLTLAAMVEAEKIDILIDLAGLSAPHLLVAFGGRIAPCQVAWLNAPYGTGLDAVDYLLTDRFVDAESPDCRGGDREACVHLDLGCVPIIPASPDAPVRERNHSEIDFAADATLADLDPATVALWAEILHRVPGSKLMLRDRGFRDPETLAELIDRFGNFGVADRVDIVAADSAEALFAEADIVLLPLAYPQPATVAAALHAGVPLVCAAGEGCHRRLAASVIHHLGLGAEAIAQNAEDYARLALHWAEQGELRRTFRASLGERLSASDAADPRARARDLQAGLERMWRETCTSGR